MERTGYVVMQSRVTSGYDLFFVMSDGEEWLGSYVTRREAQAAASEDRLGTPFTRGPEPAAMTDR